MPMGPDLAELRKRAGLSIRETAKSAGIGAHSLSLIERGERDPRASTVEKVVEACGGTVVFYGRAQTPSSIVTGTHGDE